MRNIIISRSFQSLYGKPCWGLNYERSLNLSMNFGEPSLNIREPFVSESSSEIVRKKAAQRLVTVRGEWWLWIYSCRWRLLSEGLEIAAYSSSIRRIESAIRQLSGQKLVSAEVEPVTGETQFHFDLGCVLQCRRNQKPDDSELWLLYKPNGFVISVCNDGSMSQEQCSADDNRVRLNEESNDVQSRKRRE